jgi:hypothetical protein
MVRRRQLLLHRRRLRCRRVLRRGGCLGSGNRCQGVGGDRRKRVGGDRRKRVGGDRRGGILRRPRIGFRRRRLLVSRLWRRRRLLEPRLRWRRLLESRLRYGRRLGRFRRRRRWLKSRLGTGWRLFEGGPVPVFGNSAWPTSRGCCGRGCCGRHGGKGIRGRRAGLRGRGRGGKRVRLKGRQRVVLRLRRREVAVTVGWLPTSRGRRAGRKRINRRGLLPPEEVQWIDARLLTKQVPTKPRSCAG